VCVCVVQKHSEKKKEKKRKKKGRRCIDGHSMVWWVEKKKTVHKTVFSLLAAKRVRCPGAGG